MEVFATSFKYFQICDLCFNLGTSQILDFNSRTPSEFASEPNDYILYVRGAFEIILNRSVGFLVSDGRSALFNQRQRQELLQHMTLLSNSMRGIFSIYVFYLFFVVIAFAQRQLPFLSSSTKWSELNVLELEHELTFIGYCAFSDEIRPEAAEAIRSCQKAGIMVKIISGDSSLHCLRVANAVGISSKLQSSLFNFSNKNEMEEELEMADESFPILKNKKSVPKVTNSVPLLSSSFSDIRSNSNSVTRTYGSCSVDVSSPLIVGFSEKSLPLVSVSNEIALTPSARSTPRYSKTFCIYCKLDLLPLI